MQVGCCGGYLTLARCDKIGDCLPRLLFYRLKFVARIFTWLNIIGTQNDNSVKVIVMCTIYYIRLSMNSVLVLVQTLQTCDSMQRNIE